MSGRIDFDGIALANPLHEVAGREVWEAPGWYHQAVQQLLAAAAFSVLQLQRPEGRSGPALLQEDRLS